ncbi:putative zinc-binding peptidase [Litoribacter ruber]|uniref:zinc-binding metallopeptidase family protein n=1 Tax=Litoribacter ruber TaxID=702568 RepID=UPI001BDA4BCE|nr:putative zinc-binding peptidase [Litoribacter ruber]MBT0810059.1 putative zinc-binding peptidase [Litoribacter ruber]
MRLFKCHNCEQPVYFENFHCANCKAELGFDPRNTGMKSLSPVGEYWNDTSTGETFKKCHNHQHGVCNWLLPADSDQSFCLACSLNRTIPNLSNPEHLERWTAIEQAKHRLIYALIRWNVPVVNKLENAQEGLVFDFKSDEGLPPGQRVLTGHADGVITMNISEADDVEREMARNQMDEVYRTVLGHFRHEVGHYYWDRLVMGSPYLDSFRDLFGDERKSYQKALDQHYENGPPQDWRENFISSYATMHPWEDWAETWAHYLHIVDTLDTAFSYGLSIHPNLATDHPVLSGKADFDPYLEKDFDQIIKNWFPLSLMINSLNRSMGARDAYPFVITPTVQKKLKFVHEVIKGQTSRTATLL